MFIIALMGEIFGFIGLFVPFVYVTERAIGLGVKDTEAAFLLSVIGQSLNVLKNQKFEFKH